MSRSSSEIYGTASIGHRQRTRRLGIGLYLRTSANALSAISKVTVTAYSLNVAEPTLENLAEQMLCGGGPEFVRICLPHIKRKRDDPWFNGVLSRARSPESLKLRLQRGIDLDVPDSGDVRPLHYLASGYCKWSENDLGDVRHAPFAERRALAFCVFEMTRGRGFAPNSRAANEWMRGSETKAGCLDSPCHDYWGQALPAVAA
jgi:hypothetical protein